MKNPWETISLTDYENHMKLDTVMQLQVLNNMMREQFSYSSVGTIMILGVAGGNGLEHIDTDKIKKVYGVDINNDYLEECKTRYDSLKDIFECLCVDLRDNQVVLPTADMVIADLLIEYIGYECFQKTIKIIKPEYVSCIIQINTCDSFVSDSPYIHVFDNLSEVHYQIDEYELENVMEQIEYSLIKKCQQELPNGKKFIQLDFKKSTSLKRRDVYEDN